MRKTTLNRDSFHDTITFRYIFVSCKTYGKYGFIFALSGLNSAGLIVISSLKILFSLKLLLNINAYNMFNRLKTVIVTQNIPELILLQQKNHTALRNLRCRNGKYV